jgi:hypothetical protein
MEFVGFIRHICELGKGTIAKAPKINVIEVVHSSNEVLEFERLPTHKYAHASSKEDFLRYLTKLVPFQNNLQGLSYPSAIPILVTEDARFDSFPSLKDACPGVVGQMFLLHVYKVLYPRHH